MCDIPSINEVIGLDISETALKRANQLREEAMQTNPNYKKARFINDDFFKCSGDQFDLIFDYTFLCALKPEMREKWADKYSELLKAETGELVTLIFPLKFDRPPPPHEIDFNLVDKLLSPRGFQAIESRACDMSHKPRQGNEWLARWMLKGIAKL